MKQIIFTDLDGTFLNHHDYAFDDALEAIAKVKAYKIPLIFTTSKTKSEVERLQAQVGIAEPFIVENGASLFIPDAYQGFDLSSLQNYDDQRVVVFGESYGKVLEFYRSYRTEFGMVGFSDMTDEKVGKAIGLDQHSVIRAKQRDFTEPFVLKDERKLEELQQLAQGYQLKITRGGRFYHLMGELQDKGVAVSETIELFENFYGTQVKTMALGDSQNDLEMLGCVDVPIVIKKYDGTYLETGLEHTQKSSFVGSKGWNEMVLKNV